MGTRRRALLGAVAATLLTALVPTVSPAAAAEKPDLDVRITGLSPSTLEDEPTVTMSGTVTNENDHAWADAQAYLVIPGSPFTTRKQVDAAIDSGAAYTGERVVDLKSIDELGDLAPGSTRRFEVRVPYGKLGISGAEGIYPVGVQILGTDVDGTRDTAAIGRATTFMPLVSTRKPTAVPTSVVWPFLMPDRITPDGHYADPKALVRSVSPGGRLRNQLDLALATRPSGSTTVVDPALLVGLDDIRRDRRLPDDVEIDDDQRAAVTTFHDDLVRLARRDASWVLDFDRPDLLGITRSTSAGELTEELERATARTLARFQLTGRAVSWPASDGVTGPLLSALRETGEKPVIVPPTALPGWERRDGSVVQYSARSGPMPLVVNDSLDTGVPGRATPVTLRQRILGEAALASLQSGIDPETRADAVTVIDPRWDPGSAGGTVLDAVFDAPYVDEVTLDDLMTRRLVRYEGTAPRTTKADPVDSAQLAAAAEAAGTADLIGRITPDSTDIEAAHAVSIAQVLGVRWRGLRDEGLAAARSVADRVTRDLAKVSIEGPNAVTLSSSEGSFPITITNEADHPVRVGVRIGSSNPALSVPDTEPVDVAAGERQTITVAVDMGQQSSATLSARMVTPDGEEFADAAVFNVRSSRVGAALWVAIGLAAAFVVFALYRRFRGHRPRGERDPLPQPEPAPDD